MQDYQRIADDVHSALFNSGQDGEDVLQAIAAEYGLAIDEVNERLRQCGAFLRRGLRSEAIQLCDVEPNLLDVVQIVDFPERPSWNELLRLHGLAAPAELRHDVAADLNEAYALEQPLATLLQRHRLLAMSRGPMKLRLDTLRKLANADPDNPIWAKDVQVFEDERLKELQWEVPKAISAGDTKTISALAAELESGKWLIRQPEALIRQIAAAQSNVASRDGLAEMQRVGDLLYDAFTAFDVDTGRTLREHWDRLHTLWGEPADAAMIEHVAPALDWLREQDEIAEQETRHEAAVAALTKAIMEHEPFTEVSKLYRAAKRDGELPKTAEKRYTDYLDALQRSARRRTRLALLAATVAVTAIVAIVTLLVISSQRAGQAERAVQTLTQFVQDGDSGQAQSYLDKLAAESPRIAEDPRIQELGKQMQKRLINEERRRRAFAATIELVQKSIADRHPDRELLTKAGSLVTSDQERNAVRKLEQEINEKNDANQRKVDQEFLAAVNELKGRIVAVEKAVEDNPDASISKLSNIQIELTKLEDSGPEFSPAAKKQAELLRARLKTLDEEIRSVSQQAGQDDLITAACEDSAIFRERLQQYIRSYPNARRSISFREVLNEAQLWNWVGQWNELVQSMGRKNIRGKDRKAVAEDAAKLRKFLEDQPGHPDADAFRQRLPYLDAVVRRSDGEGNPIEAALKPIFTDPMVAGAWMLADTAGEKYYLLEDPTPKFGSLYSLQPSRIYGFEYVVGFDLSKKRKSLRGNAIVPGGATAPQRVIAQNVNVFLSTVDDNSWEPCFCGMMNAILRDRETDPLLKIFLLKKVLAVGCQGSVCLEKGFSRYTEFLNSTNIPAGVNWIDPDDPAGNQNRPIAAAQLAKLPDFIAARDATAKELRALLGPIGSEYQCIGWLRRKMGGQWQCLTLPNLPKSGKLFVVRKDKETVLEPVGHLDQDKATIDAAPGSVLLEGRPVYLAKPPTKGS